MVALVLQPAHRQDNAYRAVSLYWARKTPKRDSRFLFPIYWQFADRKKDTSLTAVPPFFVSREGKSTTYGIFPLAWYNRDKEAKTRSLALLPFFYRQFGEDRGKFLTALFGFGHKPTGSFWYVPPAYFSKDTTHWFGMLAPLWFRHENRVTETTTQVIPPLLHFSRRRPGKSLSVWLGLLWRHKNVYSQTTFAPLFLDREIYNEKRTTMLLPFFVHHRNALDNSKTTVVPLFYRRTSPTKITTVLFPLYWDFQSKPADGTAFETDSGEAEADSVAADRSYNEASFQRRTQLLLPLYGRFKRPGYDAHWVFPTFYYSSGKTKAGVKDGTYRFMFAPFWESAVKKKGDYMWKVLLGMFGYEKTGRDRFMRLFFLPFELAPAPRQRTTWYRAPPERPLLKARGANTAVW